MKLNRVVHFIPLIFKSVHTPNCIVIDEFSCLVCFGIFPILMTTLLFNGTIWKWIGTTTNILIVCLSSGITYDCWIFFGFCSISKHANDDFLSLISKIPFTLTNLFPKLKTIATKMIEWIKPMFQIYEFIW